MGPNAGDTASSPATDSKPRPDSLCSFHLHALCLFPQYLQLQGALKIKLVEEELNVQHRLETNG